MQCIGVHSSCRRLSAGRPAVATAPCMHRLVVVQANNTSTANAEVKQSMLQTVHRWFDSLHLPDHPLEVSRSTETPWG